MKRGNIIIILIVIFIVLLGILYFVRKRENEVAHTTQISKYKQVNQKNNEENINFDKLKNDSNLIVKSKWGVSFLKTSQWNISENSDKKVIMDRFYKGELSDTLTIGYFEGNQISDSDAKFGNVTYYFDSSVDNWMRIGNIDKWTDGGDGSGDDASIKTTLAKVISYTEDGLPVFNGVGRWRTFIIPLDYNCFIKINITGSGDVKPLLSLLKTIKIK